MTTRGAGRSMHEDPQIPNFAGRSPGAELGMGMTLAIEPMITAGRADVYVDEDAGMGS